MTERWAIIEQYPDYEVSDLGQVRRLTPGRKTYPGKILKPLPIGQGYLSVTLVAGGEVFRRYIHRLVAAAFIGLCPDRLEVNHRNGIKTDNRSENLEYVTRSGNVRHALDTGLKIPKRGADSPLWRGGKPQGPGRPRGADHWTARNPSLIARGEASGKNKLSAAEVARVRERVAAGERQNAVAADVGLSTAQVCRIVNATRWAS